MFTHERWKGPEVRRLGGVMILAFAVGACGESDGGTEWRGTVQDSAGVSIVTNPGSGIWTDETRWTAEEEVRIGVESGDPELQFGLVTGLDVDDDGRIYVLDAQAARVRVFSPDGELVHAFGSAGGGPGELGAMGPQGGAMGLFITSDGNLMVPDMGNFRLARFTPDGDPLESQSLDFAEGIPFFWSVSGNRVVHKQLRRMSLPGLPAVEGGPRDMILALAPDGTVADTLAILAAGQTFEMGENGLPRIRLFAPETVWTVTSDGQLVTGFNSEYSMNVWGADHAVSTVMRREFTRRPVTESERSSFRSAMRGAWEDAGMPEAAANAMMQNVEFEENWPALSAVLGGMDGTIWVQRVDPSKAMDVSSAAELQSMQLGSENWDIFDRDGRYLGPLTMPTGFVPRRVIGNLVYGIHQDELEVQRVMRVRIEGPNGG